MRWQLLVVWALLLPACTQGGTTRRPSQQPHSKDSNPLASIRHAMGGGSRAAGGGSANLLSLLCPATDLGIEVTPFPIRSDDVCGSFGLNVAHNTYACLAFGQLGATLGNPPLRCAPHAIPMHADTDPDGVPVPQPLPDRRVAGQLPQVLPADEVLQREGATFSWLHSHIQRIYTWALCDELGDKAAWVAPKGWQLLKMVHIANDPAAPLAAPSAPHLKASSLPFMAILKQDAAERAGSRGACMPWARRAAAGTGSTPEQLCDGGHLLFVIRGTVSPYEWALDYRYSMQPDPRYGPGMFHSGFLQVANQLWEGGMQQALEQEVLAGGIQHITVTGHSLGGASTTLLSARAQAYINQAFAAFVQGAASHAPRLTAVTFGGASVGDAAFAKHYDSLINARQVQYRYDVVYQLPCAPQITSCAHTPVPTSNAAGAWAYARVGGQVRLDATMPVQDDAWSKLSVLRQHDACVAPDSPRWVVDATHYCAYFCKLGQFAGHQTWCRLWPEEGGAGGGSGSSRAANSTYCFAGVQGSEYPKQPAFPFPQPAAGTKWLG